MARLPGRDELVLRIDSMLEDWLGTESGASLGGSGSSGSGSGSSSSGVGSVPRLDAHHLPEPKPPAVYAIGVVDYARLAITDPQGVGAAVDEIAWRLDKLVRSGDVLGIIVPNTFVLATAAMAPSSAGVVMERITGAFAMPLDIGGETVSLRAAIGLAFAFDGASPESMLAAAERDMQRSLGD